MKASLWSLKLGLVCNRVLANEYWRALILLNWHSLWPKYKILGLFQRLKLLLRPLLIVHLLPHLLIHPLLNGIISCSLPTVLHHLISVFGKMLWLESVFLIVHILYLDRFLDLTLSHPTILDHFSGVFRNPSRAKGVLTFDDWFKLLLLFFRNLSQKNLSVLVHQVKLSLNLLNIFLLNEKLSAFFNKLDLRRAWARDIKAFRLRGL